LLEVEGEEMNREVEEENGEDQGGIGVGNERDRAEGREDFTAAKSGEGRFSSHFTYRVTFCLLRVLNFT
jgi:hypothetical protein